MGGQVSDGETDAAVQQIRVLHVDDDAAFVELAAEMLAAGSDRVSLVTEPSADGALRRLATGEVDCVLSEYDLPGTDGVELLRTVRADHPDLPFVLLTDSGTEAVASEAVSAGVTDYYLKDADTDQFGDLCDRIVDAVESYRRGRSLEERNRELRKYERMVNAMREAACIYDTEGRFEVVNDHLADWYGTSPEQLEGQQSSLVPQIRGRGDTDPFEELLAGDRQEIHGELSGEFPGRGHAVIEYRLTPLATDGSVDGAVGVARDVTEQKERERELRRQNERLDEFASVVSHDLRNPLNVAEGRLEMTRAECDSEHLGHVDRALDRMAALIDDLLALARGGEGDVDPEPTDLAEMTEGCWETVVTAEATLVTRTDRTIYADRSRFKQLAENLVRNAVDHGGEDVTVTVGDLEDGFYVADDGPGIPDHQREEVLDAGYSTNDAGTGFGLSIVEDVVEAHDWTITVTESADGGARFEITGVEFVSE